jgi:DNA-nicking Smr family endonuclease
VLAKGKAVKGLDQLDALRKQIADRQAQALAQAQREAQAAARRAAQARIFADAVGEVTPLKDTGRVVLKPPAPSVQPLQRQKDERRVLHDALSDEFGVEQLLQTDDQLSFRRPGIGPDVLTKLRRGHWVIQAELDLHGARSDEAREQLVVFLKESEQLGLRCVRVIHGKGHGSKDRQPVLKGKVRSWLTQKEEVIAFVAARPAEGGNGALVVLLRPGDVGRG